MGPIKHNTGLQKVTFKEGNQVYLNYAWADNFAVSCSISFHSGIINILLIKKHKT